MVRSTILGLLEAVDRFVVQAEDLLLPERRGLAAFMFHTVFRDRAEIERQEIAPQQAFVLDHYRLLIETSLERGYRFVSPEDIRAGLDPKHRCVWLTLDDGYYNNVRLLPVLEEFRIPVSLFVTSGPVAEQRIFWWDCLYRNLSARGKSQEEIRRASNSLKRKKTSEIESWLKQEFGPGSLKPISDLDRPLRVDELKDLSRHPLIHIGSHTRDHAILTNYPLDEARQQVCFGQEDLAEWLGSVPLEFAYPNGSYRAEHTRMVEELGIRMAVTVEFRHNPHRLGNSGRRSLRMGRYCFSAPDRLIKESARFRSRFSPYLWARRAKTRFTNARRSVVGQPV